MKRPSHGFTLVELLVVITIIGMLVGLLLPAVNMARESGRRTVCENNLKQLSAATLQHVSQFGFYPGGGWGSNSLGDPDLGTGASQPGGWIYQILPFMEANNLHDLGKGSTTPSGSNTYTLVSMSLPVLYCPTRRANKPYPYSQSATIPIAPVNANNQPPTQAGRTDYAINGGNLATNNGNVVPPWTPFPDYPGPSSLSAANGYPWPSLTTSGTGSFNGIAAIHSQVVDANVTDNKDTTYLIGEKYMAVDNYITGSDPGDLGSAMSGDDVSLIRWGSTTLLPVMDRLTTNNPPANPAMIFGASHGAGWHAAFCDGHVQMIGWAIDGLTHQTMASINGVKRIGYAVVNPANIPK